MRTLRRLYLAALWILVRDAALIFTYNRNLAKLMSDKKIPHEYRQLPGGHSWAYWDQQIRPILEIAAQKMRMPGAVKPQARATRA